MAAKTTQESLDVLVLSLVDPDLQRDGGTLRTRATLGYLSSLGHHTQVAFPSHPLSGAQSSGARLRPVLARLKRHYLPMPTRLGAKDRQLAEVVASSDADLIQVSVMSQFQFAQQSEASVWLDLMDVWSEFAAREAETRRGLSRATTRLQARGIVRAESRAARDALLVTAAGWGDVRSLRDRGIAAEWLPTTLPDAEFALVPRVGDARPTAGFIGNFDYWPNRDAYERLVAHWVRPLQEMGWRVIVGGLGSDTLPLAGTGVETLGPVDDVAEFYGQIDLSLAPMLLGGGIKVKVIESLARGVPVLGTEFAFDGFPPEFHERFVIRSLDGGFGALPKLARTDPTADPLLQMLTASGGAARVDDLLRSVSSPG